MKGWLRRDSYKIMKERLGAKSFHTLSYEVIWPKLPHSPDKWLCSKRGHGCQEVEPRPGLLGLVVGSVFLCGARRYLGSSCGSIVGFPRFCCFFVWLLSFNGTKKNQPLWGVQLGGSRWLGALVKARVKLPIVFTHLLWGDATAKEHVVNPCFMFTFSISL